MTSKAFIQGVIKAMNSIQKIGFSGLLLGLASVVLSGCGSGVLATPSPESPAAGVQFSGRVHGGQQAITGASVYLYKAGTSGYGSAATSLLNSSVLTNNPGNSGQDTNNNYYVTTDSNGNFVITGDYSCSSTDLVYLLVVGGDPSPGTANPDLEMMAALGPCNATYVSSSTVVNVNELTTVASVYALQQFFYDNAADTACSTLSHVGGIGTCIGTTSTNTAGLTNAMEWVYNLVNPSTGVAPGSGQPNGVGGFAGLPSGLTIPSATINALGNILAYCVNSNGSTCSSLFSAATPPTGSFNAGTAPTNTLQAALNIAQNPGVNISSLWGQISGFVQFGPVLAAQPNDWTLNVKIVGGGISLPYQVAADGSGNIWVTNNTSTSTAVTEISPTGAFLSGTTGWTGTGIKGTYGIALDLSGNAWVTDTTSGAGGISEISPTGTVSGPFTGGGLLATTTPRGIAVDPNGNIWAVVAAKTTGTESLNEFNSSGTLVTGTIDVSGILTNSAPYGIALDSSGCPSACAGDIWVTNTGAAFTVSKLTSSGGAVTGSPYTDSSLTAKSYSIAIDANGNAWAVGGTAANVSEISSTGSVTAVPQSQFNTPLSLIVDGLNNIWVANTGTNTTNGCISEINSAGTLLSPVCYGLGGNTGSTGTSGVIEPRGMAIDGAGNLWTGSSATTLIQVTLGAAAPVVTPLALAVKNAQQGQRP